MKNKNLS